MITVDEALKIVLQRVQPLPVERIPLDHALGRVLAEDVRSDIDLPPFDRARMDGYAVRANDLLTTPATLRCIGEVAAGTTFEGRVGRGEAVKIFTGAPLPEGADAVQKVEVTRSNGDEVTFDESVVPGQFVTKRASECSIDELVAEKGRLIGPAEMAVLASFGYATVSTRPRPRVAVISTGSELIDVARKPVGAQIRNSNCYTLGSYARRAGANVENLGTVHDDLQSTREALERAADKRDVVVTSGGVSMGDYDLVKAALVEIGAEVFFDKVKIRPGKPTVFGRRGSTYFFGLPGNPVSTSVTFNVFVWPALKLLQGDAHPALPTVVAELSSEVVDSSNRRSYQPARLFIEGGRAFAQPLKWVGSSDLVAFMRANALIISGEEVHRIAKGERVEVLAIGDLEGK